MKPEIEKDTEPNGTQLRRVNRRPKVDEKAARLEMQLARLERRAAKEKFISFAVAIIIFLTYVSMYIPVYAFFAIFLLCVVLLIALAYHWEFPEIVKPLNDLFYHYLKPRGRAESKSIDEID